MTKETQMERGGGSRKKRDSEETERQVERQKDGVWEIEGSLEKEKEERVGGLTEATEHRQLCLTCSVEEGRERREPIWNSCWIKSE